MNEEMKLEQRIMYIETKLLPDQSDPYAYNILCILKRKLKALQRAKVLGIIVIEGGKDADNIDNRSNVL